MSEWNPVSVEKAIIGVVDEIVSGIRKASDAYTQVLSTNHEYDLAFARSYMKYDGPAHAKRYAAEISTEQERTSRDAADVAYRYIERSNKALEKKLDALRSIGVSVRQAYAEAGKGEW
jgi:hypothetical protein